jgi:hypothetical protein
MPKLSVTLAKLQAVQVDLRTEVELPSGKRRPTHREVAERQGISIHVVRRIARGVTTGQPR